MSESRSIVPQGNIDSKPADVRCLSLSRLEACRCKMSETRLTAAVATDNGNVEGSSQNSIFEIAMVLSTNSGSFPSNSHVSATFSILLRFGESWNPTNCEKFNADASQMGRTNLDKSVW